MNKVLCILVALFSTICVSQNTIQTRFDPPVGYSRTTESENSFGTFLRNLKLKPSNSLVKYYDGATKNKQGVYAAVVDLPIGKGDLHQCADTIMRLRADYFYQQKRYNEIHFNFTNGMKVEYSKWRLGYRIFLNGNKTFWKKTASPSDSYETYWKYLEQIFQYAGTASLAKELHPISISDLKIGDVFIKGGFPGHAVIVVDVAIKNNKKVFLLAQSYMPAQEIQILQNPNNQNNIWYSVEEISILETPEWEFSLKELKRF